MKSSEAISTFLDSVRKSCSQRHPELGQLVEWAQALAQQGDVDLGVTRSARTSVLKLHVPGERSSLATVNHDTTGEHVYVKIWRTQVERHAPQLLGQLERATTRRLGVGAEYKPPFAAVTDSLTCVFAAVSTRGPTASDVPRTDAGRWYQYVPADVGSGLPRPSYQVDPTERDERTQAHFRLQNAVADFLHARGIAVEQHSVVGADLSWRRGGVRWVGEVKTTSSVSEARQMRLGLGQILDYLERLRPLEARLNGVLVVERQPSDPHWEALLARHRLRLVWPENLETLLR